MRILQVASAPYSCSCSSRSACADNRPALPRPHLLSGAGQRPFRRRALLQSGRARCPSGCRSFLQPLGERRARDLAGACAGPPDACRRARVDGSEMRVTWIGHATVLVQTQGLNILTDPIWSERASPFSFVGPKRVRAPGVRFEDLPRIDLVLDQPQSLRPSRPADAEAAVAARPAADRHQPRQRHDPARGRHRGGRARLGRARGGAARRRGGRSSATITGARAGAPTATAPSGRPSRSACPAAISSSPATPAVATAAGCGEAARHGPVPPRDHPDRRLRAARLHAAPPRQSRGGGARSSRR